MKRLHKTSFTIHWFSLWKRFRHRALGRSCCLCAILSVNNVFYEHLPFPYNTGSGIQNICTNITICGNILEYHQQNSTTNNPSQLFIHPLARPRLTVDPTGLSQSSTVDTNQSCTILQIHLITTIRLLLTRSSCQWQLDTRK